MIGFSIGDTPYIPPKMRLNLVGSITAILSLTLALLFTVETTEAQDAPQRPKCEDTPLKFKIQETSKWKNCKWAARNKEDHCSNYQSVARMCPVTCGERECEDGVEEGVLRFRLKKRQKVYILSSSN